MFNDFDPWLTTTLLVRSSRSFSRVSRKEQVAEQREYKKKKAQKKVQRMKELEQEREEQKSKWQQFNNKAYSKTKKGQVWFLLSSPLIWLFPGKAMIRFIEVLITRLMCVCSHRH